MKLIAGASLCRSYGIPIRVMADASLDVATVESGLCVVIAHMPGRCIGLAVFKSGAMLYMRAAREDDCN
jgi:hypothetical protein